MAAAPCPTPYKRRFRDRVAALLALADIKRRDRQRQHHEQRAYRCECGGWHLTSKPHRHG